MVGLPKDTKNASREQIVALLEGLLDQAVAGKIGFVCVVHGVAGTDDVKGAWQGLDSAEKVVGSTQGLDALRLQILEVKTRAPK